ncbi:hypothetical protein CBM2623_U50002 [Cupriavidus taiwanensis]|nr:hypothetical protein CBM2608_U60018 [Cupriavidus taiwanensis]SPA38437.1 hypothetical protein CBM2623_U50002 [Cupriavidus taiwanensis]
MLVESGKAPLMRRDPGRLKDAIVVAWQFDIAQSYAYARPRS